MTGIAVAIALWFIVLGLWISFSTGNPWDRMHD